MKKYLLTLLLITSWLQPFAQSATKRVLVFTRVQGYYHESIPAGIKAMQKLGSENGFAVDLARDSTDFKQENLKQYAAIMFLNTSGRRLFTADQQMAIVNFIQSGGGFVGVHCAGCNYANLKPGDVDWPWYHRLVGATFTNHPEPALAGFDVIDRKNPASRHLPVRWEWKDELYNFRDIQPDIHVLMEVDEGTYKGGQNGANHPIAWYHEFEGGRAFYTALGHFADAYTNPVYLKHLLGGIQYAIGNDTLPDSKKLKSNK